jgi:hypothetical protein
MMLEEEPPLGAGALFNVVRSMLSGDGCVDGRDLAEDLADACAVQGIASPILTTTNLEAILATTDLVLVATSADIALVDPSMLRPGTIVCDVARPPNVAEADVRRKGVLVFDGGLVQPPFPLDLGPFQTLPKNLSWGCLGETMLLALEGATEDYSLGRGRILSEADRIAAMARKHGFEPAEPHWRGRLLRAADFAPVAEARRYRSALDVRKAGKVAAQ